METGIVWLMRNEGDGVTRKNRYARHSRRGILESGNGLVICVKKSMENVVFSALQLSGLTNRLKDFGSCLVLATLRNRKAYPDWKSAILGFSENLPKKVPLVFILKSRN